MSDALLTELFELLRIPSVSSGHGDRADLERAAAWVCELVTTGGGRAGVVETAGNPLVAGELRSPRPDAPTVLIYGHYDVQSAEPIDAWTSPPFEPTLRDGRIYARGASDDKGNFLPLLHVACRLGRRGELPVHVRVLVDGEEEVGGDSAARWVLADERGADCAIVFDCDMLDEQTPALTLGMRGIIALDVRVRTAVRDLHSGMYGGSVLNAVHALHAMLAAVLPGPAGRLRPELRAGIEEPTQIERLAWAGLPPGEELLAEAGGLSLFEGAGRSYYERCWADASLDLNGIAGGDALQPRTIIPAAASAKLSLRLAAGQRASQIRPVLESLLRSAAPPRAEVEIEGAEADPAVFDPASPALRLAAGALQRTCGHPPALVRSGGSIPVLAAFAKRRIPAIVTGFALDEDRIHAPDESFRLESLRLGERAAEELYAALAALPALPARPDGKDGGLG